MVYIPRPLTLLDIRDAEIFHTWTQEELYRVSDSIRLITDPQWDDLRFPANAINPPGGANEPGWDFTNFGWAFDAGSQELVYIIGQLPHAYKEGSPIKPHVHWLQANSGNVKWQLRYKWFNNGDTLPGAYTTISTVTKEFTYTSGTIAQISAFPEIVNTGQKISSLLLMELSRLGADGADTYTGDATMVEFDIHYQRDAQGSYREYVK